MPSKRPASNFTAKENKSIDKIAEEAVEQYEELEEIEEVGEEEVEYVDDLPKVKKVTRRPGTKFPTRKEVDDYSIEEEQIKVNRARRAVAQQQRVQQKPAPRRQQQQSQNNDGHMRKAWNDVCFQGYAVALYGQEDYACNMSYSQNGLAYTKFSIRISQGKGKTPIYLRVTTFGDLAEEVNETVIPGSHIQVQGSLTQSKGANGVTYTEVIADSVTELLDERD